MTDDSLSRREFLKGATMATMGLLLAGQEILADNTVVAPPVGPEVNCAVIGTGVRGKELLTVLSRLPNAKVAAICDTYEMFLKRVDEVAPNAEQLADYRQILDNKQIEAVFIATPSHLHKEIALAALAEGKHVYCEAPLAVDINDAKEIARAGLESKQVFRVGQQQRANPLQRHVLGFTRTGVLGKIAGGRVQWHKRQSWRRMAPTKEREKELNWRLSRETSSGLIGEVGIHQLDLLSWLIGALPVSVQGWSATTCWDDGRDVPDTGQCVFEFPGDIRILFDATLANSFEGSYQAIYGSQSALLVRDERAWLFKEADSPLLGWEVYATKEQIGEDSGICLICDATKLQEVTDDPDEKKETEAGKDATYHSVSNFLTQIRGENAPGCGPEEGYRASVIAIKANEAAISREKVAFQKEWFELK